MATEQTNEAAALKNSPRFKSLKKEMLETVLAASAKVRAVKLNPSSAEARDSFQQTLKEYNQQRGRDLYYPFIGSGLGAGPFVELLDGSVKYDMITGIGINFFGHTHPAYMEEIIEALPRDIMQGNLEPGLELRELLQALLARVGAGSRLKNGWILNSGTMVNEMALKIIRQKKAPATKVLAFKDCFAGRSTAMQEITDNPAYRQGQPVYGEVEYLPFYDPKLGLEKSLALTLEVMREHLHRYPGKFACLMIELIQGEGGFNVAPNEYYVKVFEEAKKGGLAIWVDEIQSFGRTGELFAYQKFGLNEYVDVVTIGKLLQSCAALYTEEYNPKPGLIAGTFAGSSVALRCARRTLELFDEEKCFGKDGKIEKLSQYFTKRLTQLSTSSCEGKISEIRSIGGMIAFAPLKGTQEEVKAVLMKLFDLGVIAFNCGHGPYLIRLLPPLPVMNEKDIDEVCKIIETGILAVADSPRKQA